MGMKIMLLAFAFVLVVATRVSAIADPPTVAHPPVPMPKPQIAKHCSSDCVEYCKVNPKAKSKRTCQKICSLCCKNCNCIPTIGSPKCGSWDTIMYHGVQVTCP